MSCESKRPLSVCWYVKLALASEPGLFPAQHRCFHAELQQYASVSQKHALCVHVSSGVPIPRAIGSRTLDAEHSVSRHDFGVRTSLPDGAATLSSALPMPKSLEIVTLLTTTQDVDRVQPLSLVSKQVQKVPRMVGRGQCHRCLGEGAVYHSAWWHCCSGSRSKASAASKCHHLPSRPQARRKTAPMHNTCKLKGALKIKGDRVAQW